MNTIVKHIPHTVDLNEPVKKTYIDTLLATEDNLAHCFDITLKQGVPSGAAVNAYFIRYSDNATISLTGTVSGNVASVTLNKSCYNKAGQYAIIIKLVADGVTNTVFYGEGTIFISITDTILDPENVVPSLSDLLAQISAMEAATAASKTATTNAKTATTRANNAAAKIEGMTASAVHAENANVTVSEVDGVKHFAFELPRGEKGEKGDPGTIENVTITSIDGLPEALGEKLGKTEQAADSAKLGGVAASEYAKKTDIPEDLGGDADTLGGKPPEYYIQPRNLLDNSDFMNPINQRGDTTYTDADATIDRWGLSSNREGAYCALTVNDGSITLSSSDGQVCYFYQRLPVGTLDESKPYTIAYMLADGQIVVQSGGLTHQSDYSQIVLNLANGSTLIWAALYEGEYTAETLPPYVPKGYAAELMECQRYYLQGLGAFSTGYVLPTKAFNAFVPTPVKMRARPTITIVTRDNAVWSGGTGMLSDITSVEHRSNGLIIAGTLETAPTSIQPFVFASVDFSASADL